MRGAVRPGGRFSVPTAAQKGELALVWPKPCSSVVGDGGSGTGQTGSQPHSTLSSPPLGEPLAVGPVTGAGSRWKECCGALTQHLRRGEQSCESQAFYLTLAEKWLVVKSLPFVAAQTPPTSTERKGVRIQTASPLRGLDPGHTGRVVAMGTGMLPALTPPPLAASCLDQSRRIAPLLFLRFGWCKRVRYQTLLKPVQSVGLLPESGDRVGLAIYCPVRRCVTNTCWRESTPVEVCVHRDAQSRTHQDASETDKTLVSLKETVSCLLHICPFPHSHPLSYTQDGGHRHQLRKKIQRGRRGKKKPKNLASLIHST